MIIDDKHRFAFIHIPKCAGLSVRTVLEKFDTTGGTFRAHVSTHPELGLIDMTHLPLSTLRQYYPNEYKKILIYHSISVLRDPYSRFSSSLYQHLAMYGDKPVRSISKREFLQAIDSSISFLSRHMACECLPYNYIHFQRQHTFVYDQGVCLIDSIYSTKTINKLLEDLGAIIGEDYDHTTKQSARHLNKTVFYKSSAFKCLATIILPFYSKQVKQLLPTSFKDYMSNIFYVSKDEKMKDLFESTYVTEFIGEYYAEDIELYHSLGFDLI